MCESIFKTFMCLLPVLVIVALAAGLGYYFTTRPNEMQGLHIRWPTLDDFHREAPWNASNPDEAQRWYNTGKGLQLELLNALDTSWYTYFDTAVADWDAGLDGIDPLTLTTSEIPQESECWPVDFKLKVCNGDYGETGWNGINQILMEQGSLIILSSTAKMNEFYLNQGSTALKQYTMCHEIGHGFGLPHTDESFWNRDLGNCMDYTLTPGDNMHPDITNFEFLESLYGTANGGGGGGDTASDTVEEAQETGGQDQANGEDVVEQAQNETQVVDEDAVEAQEYTDYEEEDGDEEEEVEDENGWRQATQDAWAQVSSLDTRGSDNSGSRKLPEWISNAWEAVANEFSEKPYGQDTASEHKGWRMLRSRGNLRTHALDIGQGYSIVVNVVLADGYHDQRRARLLQ